MGHKENYAFSCADFYSAHSCSTALHGNLHMKLHKIRKKKNNNNLYKITRFHLCLLSGFYSEVDKICDILGCYAAYCCNLGSKFRNSRLSHFQGKQFSALEDGIERLFLNSVNNYHHTLGNITEDRRSLLLCPSTH